MRITFISPTVSMGGGTRVIAIYANLLTKFGHDVLLVSPPKKNIPFTRKIKSLLQGKGWPTSASSSRPSHVDNLGINHKILECWRPVVDSDLPDADIVIATWWETAEWVNALSDSKGAKVYFIQGHEIHQSPNLERIHSTYSLPMHKITISNWLKDIMHDEYNDDVVDLIPNTVDHNQFFSSSRKKNYTPTIGALFSLGKVKRVNISLEVIRRLKEKYQDLRVIMFGSAMPNEMLPLPNYVEFHYLPQQDKLREIYSECDVWLSASYREGFNLPAMEAMACRTPVVSTKTGWPETSIKPGINGELAEVDDIDGLYSGADIILSSSPDKWQEYSDNALDTVSGYTWEDAAQNFLVALQHACDRAAKDEISGGCNLS